jgi:hypothetical protein
MALPKGVPVTSEQLRRVELSSTPHHLPFLVTDSAAHEILICRCGNELHVDATIRVAETPLAFRYGARRACIALTNASAFNPMREHWLHYEPSPSSTSTRYPTNEISFAFCLPRTTTGAELLELIAKCVRFHMVTAEERLVEEN